MFVVPSVDISSCNIFVVWHRSVKGGADPLQIFAEQAGIPLLTSGGPLSARCEKLAASREGQSLSHPARLPISHQAERACLQSPTASTCPHSTAGFPRPLLSA